MANADSKYEDGLTEVYMTGGPPWGFNISGGSEFGTDVFIKKVTYKIINLDLGYEMRWLMYECDE